MVSSEARKLKVAMEHQEVELIELRRALDERNHSCARLRDMQDSMQFEIRRLTDVNHQQLKEWRRRQSGLSYIVLH